MTANQITGAIIAIFAIIAAVIVGADAGSFTAVLQAVAVWAIVAALGLLAAIR